MIVLSADDLAAFSDETRKEVLRRLQAVVGQMPSLRPRPVPELADHFADINMDHVEDITRKHIGRWMEGLSPPIYDGVRLLSANGPIIDASTLAAAGTGIRHFQSATTRRTRALTGDPRATFLGWNKWHGVDDPDAKYAVSPITHQSLRAYFRMD